MRNPAISSEVKRRLLRAGFGRDYADRTERELREHWEDLVEESMRQGLSRAEAETQATAQLGVAQNLSEQLTARLKGSSWLGRNPTAGFTALALFTTYLWWFILMLAAGSATGLWPNEGKSIENSAIKMQAFRICVDWIRAFSYVAIPLLICVISQRYYCGWKPALWGCLMLSIHNSMHFFTVSGPPGNGSVAWGYSFSTRGPELLPILVPMGVFLLFTLWRFRPERAEKSDLQLC
jgi:hypothetical protein